MDATVIDRQVERIAASRALRSSTSLVRLLEFLVTEARAGHADRLKEYTLGTEVFHRGPEFDPRLDTIVRVQARRLRAKLTEYYAKEGAGDPVLIRLQPGCYVPSFEPRTVDPDPRPVASPARVRMLPIAAAAVLIAGMLLWSQRDRALALAHEWTGGSAFVPTPANAEAHALYLQAKAAYARGTQDGISDSITLFQKATRADPRYAAAEAGLAYAYLFASSNFLPPQDAMPRARAAAHAALALDPSSVEAMTALGLVSLFYDWDLASAEESARRALALNPYSSSAHELRSQILTARGRFADAEAEIQRAQDADPLSGTLAYDAGWNLIYARKFSDAADACRRALERDPGFDLARGLLGLALVLDGRAADGLPELEHAAASGGTSVIDLMLVHGYAFAGRSEDARALLGRVVESRRTRYVCAYEVGSAYAALGDEGVAFTWLTQAVEEHSDCVVWLDVEPWLDGVRADAKYQGLANRIRRPGSVPSTVASSATGP